MHSLPGGGGAGIDYQVIAPSKTPRASGDRNKSDRPDTDLLLRQHHAVNRVGVRGGAELAQQLLVHGVAPARRSTSEMASKSARTSR